MIARSFSSDRLTRPSRRPPLSIVRKMNFFLNRSIKLIKIFAFLEEQWPFHPPEPGSRRQCGRGKNRNFSGSVANLPSAMPALASLLRSLVHSERDLSIYRVTRFSMKLMNLFCTWVV